MTSPRRRTKSPTTLHAHPLVARTDGAALTKRLNRIEGQLRGIGKMIADAMQKVGNEGVITVEEAKALDTEVEIVEGMQFDRGYLSPYFITNAEKMVAELEDAPSVDIGRDGREKHERTSAA